MSTDNYKASLQADREQTLAYYNKSLDKTEQQKFLEQMLARENRAFRDIVDIACGGGTLTHHLRAMYPEAHFTLVDYNEDALNAARANNPGANAVFINDSIYELGSLADASFDLVCCWQTLSFISEPERALLQLVRIAQPGAKIYLSSMFNIDKDVDLYTKVIDHTRASGQAGMTFDYNTYSQCSIERWIGGSVRELQIVPFNPAIDFHFAGRGVGTATVMTQAGTRLQVSAGMLLNWGVLVMTK